MQNLNKIINRAYNAISEPLLGGFDRFASGDNLTVKFKGSEKERWILFRILPAFSRQWFLQRVQELQNEAGELKSLECWVSSKGVKDYCVFAHQAAAPAFNLEGLLDAASAHRLTTPQREALNKCHKKMQYLLQLNKDNSYVKGLSLEFIFKGNVCCRLDYTKKQFKSQVRDTNSIAATFVENGHRRFDSIKLSFKLYNDECKLSGFFGVESEETQTPTANCHPGYSVMTRTVSTKAMPAEAALKAAFNSMVHAWKKHDADSFSVALYHKNSTVPIQVQLGRDKFGSMRFHEFFGLFKECVQPSYIRFGSFNTEQKTAFVGDFVVQDQQKEEPQVNRKQVDPKAKGLAELFTAILGGMWAETPAEKSDPVKDAGTYTGAGGSGNKRPADMNVTFGGGNVVGAFNAAKPKEPERKVTNNVIKFNTTYGDLKGVITSSTYLEWPPFVKKDTLLTAEEFNMVAELYKCTAVLAKELSTKDLINWLQSAWDNRNNKDDQFGRRTDTAANILPSWFSWGKDYDYWNFIRCRCK